MPIFTQAGSGHIQCDECDAEFEVISTNDSYNEVSFCPFCGSEVSNEDLLDDISDDDED